MYFNSKHQEHGGQTFTKCDIQHLLPENFTGSKPGENHFSWFAFFTREKANITDGSSFWRMSALDEI